ncbi:MAG: hypothetical protein AMXMBFR47_38950 [Planctomycetota bacterium]
MCTLGRISWVVFSLAILGGSNRAAADVIDLTLAPPAVYGTDSSVGTVTLDASFPRVRTVSLMSSHPAIASVPESVTVAFGRVTATFTVTTVAVASPINVTITATHEGVSRQAVLTVRPPILTSVSFNPDPVCGGSTSVATIHINRPAPANWLCSIQGPYPPIYFSTGSIVTFAPGSMVTTKVVNTTAVAAPVAALITVRPPTGQAPNVSGYLGVEQVRVDSLTLTPSGVEGGGATLACVRLNCAAPAGGATVQLSSSDPLAAIVPTTVQIDGGELDNCFLVQTEAQASCTAVQIEATYGGATVAATLSIGTSAQLTNNDDDDRWSDRHSATVDGKVLWTDGRDVFFHDGVATQIVQPLGDLESVEDFVFGLGSGASAGSVIGGWRRGTDFAWVWRSGSPPVLVTATNPIDPGQPLNPEGLAIADGHVIMILQAFSGGNAIKHVFRVDPVTGTATNLTGNAAVPGAARVVTANGNAAWVFYDDSGNSELHWYDGAAVRAIDSGSIGGLRLARGRLVYAKAVGGVSHIFLYDSTVAGAQPVRISPDTDAAHGNFAPTTDGYHIAWLYGNADRTNLDILLAGGVQLNDADSRPPSPLLFDEFPVQLNRGQAIWKDAGGNLRSLIDGRIETVCTTPAAAFDAPYIADGYVAGFGPIQGASETDNEVILQTLTPPTDADTPLPPLKVVPTAGSRQVALRWDRIAGATAYNLYLAESPGVTRGNYGSLPGGRRIAGILGESEVVAGLVNGRRYYFVVTAVEGTDEGGESAEVSATPQEPWQPVVGVPASAFYAVAAHPADGDIAYAAGNDTVYKTVDGGFTWAPLGGAIAGRDVRALAVYGENVFALDIDGDDILRSSNGGLNWAVVVDGGDFGELNGSIAIDPSDPQVVYAGDLRLTPVSSTLVVKSVDGGDTWAELSPTDIGDLHAYAMAVGPAGEVYLGGSGVPIARSDDGGASWSDLSPGFFAIHSLAIDPFNADTVFAGTQDLGLLRTTDGGISWTAVNAGLPLGYYEPVTSIVFDGASDDRIEIATARGPYASIDGGATWVEHTQGMGPLWTYGMTQTAGGRFIAATSNGLFLLDAACLGDLDGDGAIGLQDLATLLGHFGAPAGATSGDGDTDGDGDVDLSDLAVLLGRYGTACP